MSEKGQFTMPAEWAMHEATWLSLPHNSKDWPGKFSPIYWVYGEIIRKLTASGEKVRIIVQDQKQTTAIHRLVQKTGADKELVEHYIIPNDRSWTRDTGPIFVLDGEGKKHIAQFQFTGWAKYPNFRNDENIAASAALLRNLPLCEPSHKGQCIVLEGGAIDVNGSGTMLTTEECLLDPEVQVRNAHFDKQDYEEIFGTYLGIKKTIWLGKGIAGDDTHGHVDDLARFVDERRIVLCDTDDSSDDNYSHLKENFERLEGETLADGIRPEVIALPMPEPLFFDGVRLPASYANFYIANNAVLVPTFNDPNDRKALGILAELFPERKIIGIHAVDLVWGFGTLHCLTQQEPA